MEIGTGDNRLYLGDCTEILRSQSIPEVDLVIADPPYWKVVGEPWDYQWRTETDYIDWCRIWMSEVFDKMRVGGTFFLFGYFRMLGLLLPELRSIGFSLRQQIVVDKGMRSVAGRATKNYRMFPNTTESILFLIKDNIPFSRRLLKDRQAATGLSAKEINERLGVKSNGGGMWSIYTGKNVCGQFPTKEIWDRLRTILEFNEPYERVAQTFNPIMGLSDVWTDIDFCEGERFHPTQKPLKLLERLISVASNDGDVVLDPFFGSGNALIAARNMNRRYIGIEKDENYFKVASQRLK